MPFGVVTGQWDRLRNRYIRWKWRSSKGKGSFGDKYGAIGASNCNQWAATWLFRNCFGISCLYVDTLLFANLPFRLIIFSQNMLLFLEF